MGTIMQQTAVLNLQNYRYYNYPYVYFAAYVGTSVKSVKSGMGTGTISRPHAALYLEETALCSCGPIRRSACRP